MRLRILLSEGTSLSAREVITTLGRSGRTVEICAPLRRCFGSHSKWVDRVHIMPAVGLDPGGYVRAIADLCARERIDVLLPAHEQAYLFAALRRRESCWPIGRTAVPVASYEAFAALQTKNALAVTLAAVGLPQPITFAVESPGELLRQGEALLQAEGACVVKTISGTASIGLHRVRSRRHLEELCAAIVAEEESPEGMRAKTGPWLLQQMMPGPLERFQGVFMEGKLVAAHCHRQLIEGLGGGDVLKESVSRPIVISHLQALGAHLRWHGALSFDYILEAGSPTSPRYIDANPRLVEPVNAYLSGVNLAEALVGVAEGGGPKSLIVGRAGVRTRSGILGMVERASATNRRGAVISDVVAQLFGRGRYAGSTEELTPCGDDARSMIPFVGVMLSLLARPFSAHEINRATIESYALGPRGHQFVRELSEPPTGGRYSR